MKRGKSEKRKKYLLNENDSRPPVRYKETQRHHRRNKEFTALVKREKYRQVKGRCEICNCKLSFKKAHFHHVLSLSYAFHYYPEIPDEVLKSIENCQVLCENCHVDIHQSDSLAYYSAIAQNILAIIDHWQPFESPLKYRKKKKRKRENAAKYQAELKKQKSTS